MKHLKPFNEQLSQSIEPEVDDILNILIDEGLQVVSATVAEGVIGVYIKNISNDAITWDELVMIKDVLARLQVNYTISESVVPVRYPTQYGMVTVYSDGGVKGYTPTQLNKRLANDYIMGIHFHINIY